MELLDEAGVEPFAAPRTIALRLAFRLRLGAPGETTTGAVLVYPWIPDARERGAVHHLELARGYLLRRRLAHVEADVEGLAIDVALPSEERRLGYARLVWHQRHLPKAVIRDVCDALRQRA